MGTERARRGLTDGEDRPGPLVFGLPGNPVSGLVGYLLFVRPALAVLSHRPAAAGPPCPPRLARPFRHRGDRPTYYPARRIPGPARPGPAGIETLDWAGSADLRTVASADGFAAFPAGDRDYEPGESRPFVRSSVVRLVLSVVIGHWIVKTRQFA